VPVWKAFVWSVVGFLLPVLLGVALLPRLFNRTLELSTQVSSVSRNLSAASSEDVSDLHFQESIVKDFVEIPIEKSQFVSNPLADTNHNSIGKIVQVSFKIEKLPEVGKRARILLNYLYDTPPYKGWALAVRRLPASIRPEVYWQGEDGKGGWFTFGDLEISVGDVLNLTFLATKNSILGLSANIYKEGALSLEKASKPKFLGGFDVKEIGGTETEAKLLAVSGSEEKSGAVVRVRELIFANLPIDFDYNKNALSVMSMKSSELVDYLGEEQLKIWVKDLQKEQIAKPYRANFNPLT
jgi:hypothetical protein